MKKPIKRVVSFEKFLNLRQVVSDAVLAETVCIDPDTVPLGLEEDVQDLLPPPVVTQKPRKPGSENCLDYTVQGVPALVIPVPVSALQTGIPGIYQIETYPGPVIYVGQTKCLRKRFDAHEHAVGKPVFFRILETRECEELSDRLQYESKFILRRLKEGHPLLNDCHVVKAFKHRQGLL